MLPRPRRRRSLSSMSRANAASAAYSFTSTARPRNQNRRQCRMQSAKTTRLARVPTSLATQNRISIAPLPIRFTIGECYTRDEIHGVLGGSKVSCLPSVNGKLVAACLSLRFSPAAPTVVLCGQGPKTGPASRLLTLQREELPIFIKKAAGRWQFCGAFRVVEFLAGGPRFEEFIAGSGRSVASVSYVVLLRPN